MTSSPASKSLLIIKKKKGRKRRGKAMPSNTKQQLEVNTAPEKDEHVLVGTPQTSPDSNCGSKTTSPSVDDDALEQKSQEDKSNQVGVQDGPCEDAQEHAKDNLAVSPVIVATSADTMDAGADQEVSDQDNSANEEPALVAEGVAENEIISDETKSDSMTATEQESELIKTGISQQDHCKKEVEPRNLDLHLAEAENVIIPSPKASQSAVNQQALMIESGKLLEHLRTEIYKLRSQNSQLRSDFQSLQGNNQRLMNANSSLGSTFDNLNTHAKQMSKANGKMKQELQKTKDRLQTERTENKAQIQLMTTVQMELKEELKMKQGTYIAEVHSRLNYQKVLANVVDKVQGRCRDDRLVEEILAMSDEYEL
jgi:hypothetical protein